MGNLVGILVVGNEILDGVVLDTNSQWIINRLKPLGFQVHEAITVRDNIHEIGAALNRLIDDGCGLVFTTGGLGPTHDDMTLQGVAHGLGLPLELDQASLDIVTRQYRVLHERGIIESGEMTDSRRKMAILPQGSRPLDNRVGGAPGVLLEVGGSTIICLPGVPLELKWIFDDQVAPILKSMVRGVYAERIVALPLRDESTLAPIIDQVMGEVPGVYVKSMVKPYGEEGIRLWVSSMGEDQGEVEDKVARTVDRLVELTRERLPNG
jgi:nicotinamide-nucleotide amidase